MGIQGLWQLLEPGGTRIPIESLATKVLAVDASIWLVQFVKAMRDDAGRMLPNAHVLGSLRRIMRLLFQHVRRLLRERLADCARDFNFFALQNDNPRESQCNHSGI